MSKNVLKIVPIHVYRFSFFNTSNTYRAFSNYFWLRCKPLVNSRVGDSNRLLSEVFERKADYFILTTSSKKNFSLIASRMETKYLKYCENYVFVWKLSRFYIFSFFHAAYLSRWKRTTFADQGLLKMVAFFRIPSKIFMSGTWDFANIKKNIKAIFREYFSSLYFDSGMIIQDNRKIKIHVYAKRQTSEWSWEFLRIGNKQIKTVQNNSYE